MPVYPLIAPTAPGPVSASLRLLRTTAVNESPFTRQQQVFEHPGKVWAGEIALPPMGRAPAAAWDAFILKLHGRVGTFLMTPPGGWSPRGTATGALVAGPAQTGLSLAVDGMGADRTLLAGDYIQIGAGGAARLHKLVEDATADGAGAATLTIEPDLRQAPNDDDAVTVVNPKGLFRLIADDVGFDLSTALHYGFAFGFVEAL